MGTMPPPGEPGIMLCAGEPGIIMWGMDPPRDPICTPPIGTA